MRALDTNKFMAGKHAERSANSRTFGSSEVDDVSISLEHVDLLDCLNWLNVELLQGSLQLLVIHSRALVDLLDLSSGCAFSTVDPLVSLFRLSNGFFAQSTHPQVYPVSRIAREEVHNVP